MLGGSGFEGKRERVRWSVRDEEGSFKAARNLSRDDIQYHPPSDKSASLKPRTSLLSGRFHNMALP